MYPGRDVWCGPYLRIPALTFKTGEIRFSLHYEEFDSHEVHWVDGECRLRDGSILGLRFPKFVLVTTRRIKGFIEFTIEARPFATVVRDVERRTPVTMLSGKEQYFIRGIKWESAMADADLQVLAGDIVADL